MNTLYQIAQEQIVARFLMYPDTYYQYADRIKSDDFLDVYKVVISAIEKHGETNKSGEFDLVTLSKQINNPAVDLTFLMKLTSRIDFSNNFESYIDIFLTESHRYRVRDMMMHVAETLDTSEINETKEYILTELNKLECGEREMFKPIQDILNDVICRTQDIHDGKIINGIATGFKFFDEFSGGLQNSDLIIIAGETSQGKTTLALDIANNIAMNEPVAFYSYEMSELQLGGRILSMNSDVENKMLTSKTITSTDIQLLHDAAGKLSEQKLYIADLKNNTLQFLCNSIRAMFNRTHIKLVVVDYLQLITNFSKGGSREQQVGDVARFLKNLAKELNIPIVLLSQLARDRNTNRPSLARLRDSGQIEESADVVLFVHRPEAYNVEHIELSGIFYDSTGLAEIIIAKGRNIGTGKFALRFFPSVNKFKDVNTSLLQIVSASSVKKHNRVELTDDPPF